MRTSVYPMTSPPVSNMTPFLIEKDEGAKYNLRLTYAPPNRCLTKGLAGLSNRVTVHGTSDERKINGIAEACLHF